VSPDGALLASCGDDGTARLWSLADLGAERISPRLTLINLERGWAAIASDGRYKSSGDLAGQIWQVIGLSRFELGELDPYLGEARQLSAGAPF
jgi:hypothetical protein